MIKEISFLELLEKEKEVVFQYNLSMSRISDELKFYNQRLIEEQGDKEEIGYINSFHNERIERFIFEKNEAEKTLKDIRTRVKEYFSSL